MRRKDSGAVPGPHSPPRTAQEPPRCATSSWDHRRDTGARNRRDRHTRVVGIWFLDGAGCCTTCEPPASTLQVLRRDAVMSRRGSPWPHRARREGRRPPGPQRAIPSTWPYQTNPPPHATHTARVARPGAEAAAGVPGGGGRAAILLLYDRRRDLDGRLSVKCRISRPCDQSPDIAPELSQRPFLGECLAHFSPDECRNSFRHCGYSATTRS